jgi:hypothetical protein
LSTRVTSGFALLDSLEVQTQNTVTVTPVAVWLSRCLGHPGRPVNALSNFSPDRTW